jgi:hypothetical protein
VRAAVAHQLRRPVLARTLDEAERRLAIDRGGGRVTAGVQRIVEALVRRPDAPPLAAPEEAAGDVLGIVAGMIDAAGERGETDAARLELRIERAVLGYLARSSVRHERPPRGPGGRGRRPGR